MILSGLVLLNMVKRKIGNELLVCFLLFYEVSLLFRMQYILFQTSKMSLEIMLLNCTVDFLTLKVNSAEINIS